MCPYDLRELLSGAWRRLRIGANLAVGASRGRHVDPQARVVMRVGLIGDLMGIAGRRLEVADPVSAFFADCDAVIGNLEGMIASRPWHPVAEWHDAGFAAELARIFEPSRLHLNLANNHAADFGRRIFDDTARRLRDAGFGVFGSREQPFADIGEHLRVVAGSMWTNMPCDWIANIDDMSAHATESRFVVFYPHWGYEMELQPRPALLDLGERLLERADALVGHHSHVPQAVRLHSAKGRAKVLATSLGGFCSRYREPAFLRGIIMKLAIGRTPDGSWGVAEMDWRLVQCTPARTCTIGLMD